MGQMPMLLLALSWLLGFVATAADPCPLWMPKVFGTHMVLQRNMAVPLWGRAMPGTEVRIALYKEDLLLEQTAVPAADDGSWRVKLQARAAGGPFRLEVRAQQDTLLLEDVWFGEVFLAGGQSNMEWQVQQALHGQEEIAAAHSPLVRFFKVPHNKQPAVQEDVAGGQWQVGSPATVAEFSALAYFFARDLHRLKNIPVGILQATWGGTPVEAWMPREALLANSWSAPAAQAADSITVAHFKQDSLDLLRFWELVYQEPTQLEARLSAPDYDDSHWEEVEMPVTMADWDRDAYEGIVWLRKTFVLPESLLSDSLELELGRPELNYSVFVNGHLLARNVWNAEEQHRYTLPPEFLLPGKNLLTVRMAFLWGGGGFSPRHGPMQLRGNSGSLALSGRWKYREDLEPSLPLIRNYHRYPAFLYNGMIAPLVPYGLAGFLWYQGEDNVASPEAYAELFPLLISQWRTLFGKDDLPFVFVQLANFLPEQEEPDESSWAPLRAAQERALHLPAAGMVVSTDVGNPHNIHPLNKQEVARRMLLQMRELLYGEELQAGGPRPGTLEVQGSVVELTLEGMGTPASACSLVRPEDRLEGFELAGADGCYHTASVQRSGAQLRLESPRVPRPCSVRYNWFDNPPGRLYNVWGLPLRPFERLVNK